MTPLSFDYPISVLILYSTNEVYTVETAQEICDALGRSGHQVRMFKVTDENWKQSVKQAGDITINLVEDSGWKLWGKVFRLFNKYGRNMFGIDKRSFEYSLSKVKMKKKLAEFNLATPSYRTVSKKNWRDIRGLNFPLIVKPSGEHASEGISQDSVVIDDQELHERLEWVFNKFGGEAVVEEYVEGREFHVMAFGNGKHVAVAPYCEVEFKGEFKDNWTVESYDAKWNETSWEYWSCPLTCPAKGIKKDLEKKIDKLVTSAFRALKCCDIVRFDIRVDAKENPFIIDLNVLPDMYPGTEVETWRSAKALGWTYEQFVETLVVIAYKRVYGRMPDRLKERNLLLNMPLKVG